MADRAAQQRVLAQVDPADLVGLASALIRIPSFKTEETPVARFLAPFFRERDSRVELQEVEPERLQAIATLPGTGGGARLMLNGHTDIKSVGDINGPYRCAAGWAAPGFTLAPLRTGRTRVSVCRHWAAVDGARAG